MCMQVRETIGSACVRARAKTTVRETTECVCGCTYARTRWSSSAGPRRGLITVGVASLCFMHIFIESSETRSRLTVVTATHVPSKLLNARTTLPPVSDAIAPTIACSTGAFAAAAFESRRRTTFTRQMTLEGPPPSAADLYTLHSSPASVIPSIADSTSQRSSASGTMAPVSHLRTSSRTLYSIQHIKWVQCRFCAANRAGSVSTQDGRQYPPRVTCTNSYHSLRDP